MPDPTHKSWDAQLEDLKEYGRKHGFTVELERKPVLKDKAAPEELPKKEAARG